jgi:hypothetical protein
MSGDWVVRRSECHECEALKDYYWLKVNRFLLELRSFSKPYPADSVFRRSQDDEIRDATEEALHALRALVSHLKTCYALDRERAA